MNSVVDPSADLSQVYGESSWVTVMCPSQSTPKMVVITV